MAARARGLCRQDFARRFDQERMWTEDWTPDMARTYLGGVGLGAKILWEEVPPEVTWDHPENRLILATGPLAACRRGVRAV